MKTDSLFYRLFQLSPTIFFELIGQPGGETDAYEFRSVEIKQTSFRLDGVLLLAIGASDRPVYFSEVQFQKDQQLIIASLQKSFSTWHKTRQPMTGKAFSSILIVI